LAHGGDPLLSFPVVTDPSKRDSKRSATDEGPRERPFSVARYVLRFAILLAVFEAVFLLFLVERPVFAAYLRGYAALSGEVLGWFGEEVWVDGRKIIGAGGGIDVQRGCDAFQPVALFCANVLAFPARAAQKLVGLLLGVVVLLVLNLGRIVSLFWLSESRSEMFHDAHMTYWPMGFILISLGLWLVWALWTRPR